MSDGIAALARRVQDDPFFLASALADYARSEELDEGGLAAVLDCSIDTLNRLRLCRRPGLVVDAFQADAGRIAARFGVSTDTLAEIIRRSDVLVALRRAGAAEVGLLAAARDREEATDTGAPSADAEMEQS
jgi:hypothetical protein